MLSIPEDQVQIPNCHMNAARHGLPRMYIQYSTRNIPVRCSTLPRRSENSETHETDALTSQHPQPISNAMHHNSLATILNDGVSLVTFPSCDMYDWSVRRVRDLREL